ncbi:MAG: hypothetical protein WAN43_18760 [Rhodomicrobium sp.]
MTPYTAPDLAGGWEFKVLRSAAGKFGDPFWMKGVLDEEARAGWLFLEKFDNNRVRVKRPASARDRDASLNFDPYRTWVGMRQGKFALLLTGGILAGVALFLVVLVAILVRAGVH